jgi:uncharacterized Rmd1/YagE family protein
LQDVRIRLAISFALSQSAKLAVYEEMVHVTIDRYQYLPQKLAQTGHIDIPRYFHGISSLSLSSRLVGMVD